MSIEVTIDEAQRDGVPRARRRRGRRGAERPDDRDRRPARALPGDGRRRCPSRLPSWPSGPGPTSATCASGWRARRPAATSPTTPTRAPTASRPSTPPCSPTSRAPSTRAACSSRPARPSTPRTTSPPVSAAATDSAGTSTTTTSSRESGGCSASPTARSSSRSGSRRSTASTRSSARARSSPTSAAASASQRFCSPRPTPSRASSASTTTRSRSPRRGATPRRRASPIASSSGAATATDFAGSDYDLIACFDALHDMGDPQAAARHIRAALADDGTWLIVEPNAGDTVVENLHPIGRLQYGYSVLVCTPGSLSQPGRAGARHGRGPGAPLAGDPRRRLPARPPGRGDAVQHGARG